VFIHINKTAGSSVESALGVPIEHYTAKEKIEQIGLKAWEERFTFAFVRNPWDRAVSHFHYRVNRNRTNLGRDPISFERWIDEVFVMRNPAFRNYEKMFVSQVSWISDECGKFLVDEVYRFEELHKNFDIACRKIGVSATLPHKKRVERASYQSFYNDRTREIIANEYISDIQEWGYQFEPE